MTDNKITRETTFSEELPYFKERIKEVFDNYHNPNGYEDPLYIAVLRDSKRVVRKAEEEINRQQVENKRLEKEVNLVSIQFQDLQERYEESQAEIERLKGWENLLKAEKHSLIKTEAIKEFAERLKSLVNQHHYMLANIHNSRDFGMFTVGFEQAIDNIVKEMVGDKE